jgi:hypothetical protein
MEQSSQAHKCTEMTENGDEATQLHDLDLQQERSLQIGFDTMFDNTGIST